MRFGIIIPTYWGRKTEEPFNPSDAVYDHPTPLDGQGTLERALRSIAVLNEKDIVIVVLAVSTCDEISEQVERRVMSIIEPLKATYDIKLISHSHLERIKERAEECGKQKYNDLLDLRGYSNIRNMCLFAAGSLDLDAAILFDDDQVYEDNDYLKKVKENIGKEIYGNKILGIAGYYRRPNDDCMLDPESNPVYSWWPSAQEMNSAFSIITEGARLKKTPFVFGGNMIIHKDLFRMICFDPKVTRGEDIDYLLNAKFFCHDFILDRELHIKHLPPPKTAPLWRRFREDVVRFVYTREKLRQQPVSVLEPGMRFVHSTEMDPYPGCFLGEDLEDIIFKTSMIMGMDYLKKQDGESYEECMKNIQISKSLIKCDENPYRDYMNMRKRWESMMRELPMERGVRDVIENS